MHNTCDMPLVPDLLALARQQFSNHQAEVLETKDESGPEGHNIVWCTSLWVFCALSLDYKDRL